MFKKYFDSMILPKSYLITEHKQRLCMRPYYISFFHFFK